MRLRLDPDHLFETATRLSAAADRLEETDHQLSASWNALADSWIGQSKVEVAEMYLASRLALHARIETLDALARWLSQRANLFLEADEQAGVAL